MNCKKIAPMSQKKKAINPQDPDEQIKQIIRYQYN